MSAPTVKEAIRLEPTFIFGCTSSIRGGRFLNDETIAYPIGRVLSVHNTRTNTQKYIKLRDTFRINAVAISPNRKVVAVAMTGSKPAISFYDTTSLKRLVSIGNPLEGFKVKMFEQIVFTTDNVHLIAISSEPECWLIYYKWDSAGIVAHGKADGKASAVASVLTALAPHPTNSGVFALGGIGVFRLMSLYYNEWRQFGFKRAEYWPISCICWITSELVLVGTKDGRLMVVEDALMKGEYRVSDLVEIRVAEGEEVRKANAIDFGGRSDKTAGQEVRALTAFSQGFAFASVSGEVCVFQKVGKRHWTKRNVIVTGAPALWQQKNPAVNFVTHIDISPSEKQLLATSSSSEVYFASIFQDQDPTFEEKPRFKLLHGGYHHGPVATISSCLYKPHFLTVGETDKTCRIWNFESCELLNTMTFPDNILTAAFHPTGWYCLISFEHSLKVFMVLMDGMKAIAELDVHDCRLVSYSKRGNAFACLSESKILVYAGTTFDQLWEFSTTGKVSSFHFSGNDFALFVGSLDGGLDKYCLKTGKNLFKYDNESSVVHGMTSSRDGVMLYVVGADGQLQVFRTRKLVEEELVDGGLVGSYNLNQSVLHSVAMAGNDQVLLAAGQSTAVLSFAPPNDKVAQLNTSTFKLHSSTIVKLECTHVKPTLLSLGRDGTVAVWSLVGLEAEPYFLMYYRDVDEMISNSENWSNKRSIIQEQQDTLGRLDREYDDKLTEIEEDRVKEEQKIYDRYQGVLDIISLNNKITQGKSAADIEKMSNRNSDLAHSFERELDDQRVNFEKRLRAEQDDLEKWKCGWGNVKYGLDRMIGSVKMAGQCIVKRLEYFSSMELTRRANETLHLKDDITQIIEEQKSRELSLLKNSQIEIDEFVENNERHEQLAVEIIKLRSQKKKLCEQVEGLESTYYNMQEFLRESQKTVMNLDKRQSRQALLEKKQKKIRDQREGVRTSGRDILSNLEICKAYRMNHMVSEECIEELCHLDHLLEERKVMKKKEQWLRGELVDSSRSLNRLRYVLSYLSLQSYLHDNALRKSVSREKDRNRKTHYFRTNLKKEIYNMVCGTEMGNLKGRLINLCAQYADPKLDYLGLLDKLSGNKELWKSISHLEATKLHFRNCVRRLKRTWSEQEERMMKSYVREYDDDVDWSVESDSEEEDDNVAMAGMVQSSVRESVDVRAEDGKKCPQKKKKKKKSRKRKGSSLRQGNRSEADWSTESEHRSSDEETATSCCGVAHQTGDPTSSSRRPANPEQLPRRPRRLPLSLTVNRIKTNEIRVKHYSHMLDEKKLISERLVDVRKRMFHRKNMEKLLKSNKTEGGQKSADRTSNAKIPMNLIIKALDREVDLLAQSPECRQLASDLFPRHRSTINNDDEKPASGHLCSLCKDFEPFTKHFEETTED